MHSSRAPSARRRTFASGWWSSPRAECSLRGVRPEASAHAANTSLLVARRVSEGAHGPAPNPTGMHGMLGVFTAFQSRSALPLADASGCSQNHTLCVYFVPPKLCGRIETSRSVSPDQSLLTSHSVPDSRSHVLRTRLVCLAFGRSLCVRSAHRIAPGSLVVWHSS